MTATVITNKSDTPIEEQEQRRRIRLNQEPSSDWWLLTTVVALTMLGLLMVYSATYTLSYYNFDGQTTWYLYRQAAWVGIGTGVMLLCWWLDYRIWQQWSTVFMGFIVFVLFVMFFIGQ
ncbi:MAG: FtsW/RodA/SpoVE family cell cycle protein, partial [Ardenticatenaceae bacterium]